MSRLSIWPNLQIRTKITLPFLLLFSVTIFGMLVLTIAFFDSQYDQQFSKETKQWIETIQRTQYIEEPNKVKQAYQCEVVVFGGDNTLNGTTLIELADLDWLDLKLIFNLQSVRQQLQKQNHPVINNIRLSGTIYKAVYIQQSLNRIYCLLRPMNHVEEAKKQTVQMTFIIASFGLLLVVTISSLIGKHFTRPIDRLVAFTKQVSGGDLEGQCEVFRHDEVGELTKAFNLMTKELRESRRSILNAEKLTTIHQMSTAFAHEVRNPLSSIRMLTQITLEKISDTSVQQSMSKILDEIERIEVIVGGWMDLARPTKLDRTMTDLNLIVNDVLKLMTVNLSHHHIKVEKDLTTELPMISIDADKIKQVMINLILNAMQAMPKGGKLHLTTCESEKFVEAKVSDTGLGMNSKTMGRIFDPFFTTKSSGIGLGLSTCQQLVEQHLGQITVESVIEQGTTITIKLPNL